MKLAPIVLGPGIRSCNGLPDILKLTCRWTGRVASLCGRSLDCTDSGVSGDLVVLGKFLLQGRGQSDQNLVMVGALFSLIAHILVVCVQVYYIDDDGAGVEG